LLSAWETSARARSRGCGRTGTRARSRCALRLRRSQAGLLFDAAYVSFAAQSQRALFHIARALCFSVVARLLKLSCCSRPAKAHPDSSSVLPVRYADAPFLDPVGAKLWASNWTGVLHRISCRHAGSRGNCPRTPAAARLRERSIKFGPGPKRVSPWLKLSGQLRTWRKHQRRVSRITP
jgi:hypothetical protein